MGYEVQVFPCNAATELSWVDSATWWPTMETTYQSLFPCLTQIPLNIFGLLLVGYQLSEMGWIVLNFSFLTTKKKKIKEMGGPTLSGLWSQLCKIFYTKRSHQGWRRGSVAKCACCYCRRLELSSQYLHQATHNHINSSSREYDILYWSLLAPVQVGMMLLCTV